MYRFGSMCQDLGDQSDYSKPFDVITFVHVNCALRILFLIMR